MVKGEQGKNQKGSGKEERRKKREKLDEIRIEEDEIREIERVRENGRAKEDKIGHQKT